MVIKVEGTREVVDANDVVGDPFVNALSATVMLEVNISILDICPYVYEPLEIAGE